MQSLGTSWDWSTLSNNSGRAWASPEYTRYRKRFYMCIYIYVCLWGDHFSEERVKFWMRTVMVVMRMRIRLHCTWSIWETTRTCTGTNWLERWQCCTTLARLRSTINITDRLHFPEHEDSCMEAYPLMIRAWLQVLGLMVMACGLLLKYIAV